jgi:nucleotidyltransferase substrate binding protein (TIGR01987 family)
MMDISGYLNAIAQLEDALAYCESDVAKKDPRLALHLRAGAIQAFEFTYELSIKTLRRYIETISSNDEYSGSLTFNELVRAGYEEGLLNAELVEWKNFRSNRGATSHSYDEAKAQEIFLATPVFLKEAKFLANQLKNRLLRKE